MSEDTKKKNKHPKISSDQVNWGPWLAIVAVVIIFVLAEYLGAQITVIYAVIKHWSSAHADSWLNNSLYAQFFYTLFAESITFGLIWLVMRWRKSKLSVIGLVKPKLQDIAYALTGLAIYFPIFIIVVLALSGLVHGFNANQAQEIGYSQSTSGWPLVLVFLSLVVMPPIVEEIMFRGFLYSGLKKALPKIWAVLITSVIFASPHLLESSGGGLLWVAGIDTFVLSLVLIWLREKTGRLYASMGLHALKNFIAFASLFLIHAH
jgi:membrane protease YdiL (CAAX protease family)